MTLQDAARLTSALAVHVRPAGKTPIEVPDGWVIIGSHRRAGRVRVREIGDDEGNRLRRIVRRGTGPEVTWRRAQMVSWSAQGMSVAQITGPAFTTDDLVRDVLRNFNADGRDSLYPGYAGGHPPKFTLGQRQEIKKLAESAPAEHGLPFPRWSLAKLADFPDRRGDRSRPLPPRAAGTAAGGEHLLSGFKDLAENLCRPALCGPEGTRRAPVCDRGRPGHHRAR
jgi:transposase